MESIVDQTLHRSNDVNIKEKPEEQTRNVESNDRALIPFRGRAANKHFYDVKPGESAYNDNDVCTSRESLVNETPPLELIECSRVGEFTSNQWESDQDDVATRCRTLLQDSDKLRQDFREKSHQLQNKTEKMQNESMRLLDERVRKTINARESLASRIDKATQELQALNKMKKRLQLSLIALELPENSNEECLHIRRFRVGIDNTKDNVSHALAKEFEVQRIGRNLLEKSFGEIKEAICRLSEMKRLLEHDWSDKQETAQIDHTAARLQLKDNIAQFKPVSEALNEGVSTPSSWQDQVDAHVGSSEREMDVDAQLRSITERALSEVTKDVLEAYENVDTALNVRMSSLEKALVRLKNQDEQIRREIGNQEANLKELRQHLRDKEPPLQVAQTRHYSRSFRPGIDRCLDPAHNSLRSELEELPKSISTLRTCVSRSEEVLEDLHREHEELLKNIVGREHTLSLETRCVTVRKQRPTANHLHGF